MGRLDEDLSCANSRFFRTLLYSDKSIQPVLAGYVLHWRAVRPAPRLTIDMGDGRAIETTITGNSAHMILDEDGAVVDVIPGLVSTRRLHRDVGLGAHRLGRASRSTRRASRALSSGEARSWARLASMSGARGKPLPVVGGSSKTPLAIDAGPIAMTKSMPEMPVVRSITPIDVREVKADPFFDVAAEQLKGSVIFDDNARALVKRKLAGAQSFDDVIARLQLSVAKDTVINRFVLHDAVRSWLADGITDAKVVEARLYDESSSRRAATPGSASSTPRPSPASTRVACADRSTLRRMTSAARPFPLTFMQAFAGGTACLWLLLVVEGRLPSGPRPCARWGSWRSFRWPGCKLVADDVDVGAHRLRSIGTVLVPLGALCGGVSMLLLPGVVADRWPPCGRWRRRRSRSAACRACCAGASRPSRNSRSTSATSTSSSAPSGSPLRARACP